MNSNASPQQSSLNTGNERLIKILRASPEVQAEIDRILEHRPAPPPPPEPSSGPLLMGVSEAAKLLGCSRSTVWRVCRAGRLSKIELMPGAYRLRRSDIVALAAGKAVSQ